MAARAGATVLCEVQAFIGAERAGAVAGRSWLVPSGLVLRLICRWAVPPTGPGPGPGPGSGSGPGPGPGPCPGPGPGPGPDPGSDAMMITGLLNTF